MTEIASFIKYHRKRLHLTQEELANKAGVGIRFVRELEQGKETVQLDKVNQVLSLFGYAVSPKKLSLDPYTVFWNSFNKAIKITLYDKTIKYGIIIEELKKENEIYAWRFVPNKYAIKYQKTKDVKPTEVILHNNIQHIEEQ
ncbi:MAG: helix-turn-helix transcriptional regulator [Lutibacter sp.]|nr:helix-turn-helix transcriptional regulator [Lutibacter sp.]